MNKRGVDYAVWLFVVAIICIIMLSIAIQQKSKSVSDILGNTQYPLLALNTDRELHELYLRDSSKLAFAQALQDVASDSTKHLTPEFGTDTCAQLNTLPDPTIFAANFTLYEGLTTSFNKRMQPYLERYESLTGWATPFNTFKLSLNQDAITVLSTEPTAIPLRNLYGHDIGNAAYRPSARFSFAHDLDSYEQQMTLLRVVLQHCSYQPNPSCLRNLIPSDWQIDIVDDKYRVDITRQHGTSCYLMYLPELRESQQPST